MEPVRPESYCGIYCGACEIIHAQTEEDKKRVIGMFQSELPGWEATPDQMRCDGCKSDAPFVNCRGCRIKDCVKEKGVDFCSECDEFPCAIHEQYQLASQTFRILRHLRFNIQNLRDIRSMGLENWVEDQKAKWRCSRCGEPFSWYAEKCRNCGGTVDVWGS